MYVTHGNTRICHKRTFYSEQLPHLADYLGQTRLQSELDTLSPAIHRVQVLLGPMGVVDTSKFLLLQSTEVSESKNVQ